MKRIIAEVEFGNPKLDCERFGICRISNTDDFLKLPMNFGIGLAYVEKIGAEKIAITVFQESVSEATSAVYFKNNSLYIEEDTAPMIDPTFGELWQHIVFKAGLYSFDSEGRATLDIYEQVQMNKPEELSHDKLNPLKTNCKCHRKAA